MDTKNTDELWRLEVPQTFHAPRAPAVGMLFACLVLAAIGALMLAEKPLLGFAVILFGGLGAIILGANLHPKNATLHVDDKGFRFAWLFRETYVPWRCIRLFVPVLVGNGSALVGWICEPARCEGQAVRMRGHLPSNYGLK